jgi:hypothetical protein
MRTSVAVRSVLPKAIGIVVNVSKCGSIEKVMPVAKSRKDNLEIECDTLLQVTHSVVFYIHIET